MKAVIQAGGKGARLRPYTFVLPKPLMPVNGSPVIELLIKWLRRSGLQEIIITTGHLGHLLKALCADGAQWDVDIHYSEETEPLGTVGALNLVRNELHETFLVLNGDLLTDLDLRSMVKYHRQHGEALTVAITSKPIKIDLGVIYSESGALTDFQEKPTFQYDVSMGIYCMEPEVLDLIPKGVPFGFDDLVFRMLDDRKTVKTYRHEGMWMDLGRAEDFSQAQGMCDDNSPILGV